MQGLPAQQLFLSHAWSLAAEGLKQQLIKKAAFWVAEVYFAGRAETAVLKAQSWNREA